MAIEIDLGNSAANIQRGVFVPTKILEDDLLSKGLQPRSSGSEAWECFTQQRFSANLQAFLINYTISVNSPYSVYT
jgi:hypothetical protein